MCMYAQTGKYVAAAAAVCMYIQVRRNALQVNATHILRRYLGW